MDVTSTKPKALTEAPPPPTCVEPKKPEAKKPPTQYEPPSAPTPGEKKGVLGFYAAATAPIPTGGGGSPLLPKAPPPPLPKNGATGNPLMDAVLPPPAQGAPQLMASAKLPSPNATVGPAVANGAGADPALASEVAEERSEAWREKYAEAECKVTVTTPLEDVHVPPILKPFKKIAEEELGEMMCKRPEPRKPFGALPNVVQTKKPETPPTSRLSPDDLAPAPPKYVPIPPSQGTAAQSSNQKAAPAPYSPIPPKPMTPQNATTTNSDGSVS